MSNRCVNVPGRTTEPIDWDAMTLEINGKARADALREIRGTVTQAALYELLAEEATELAHAALKLARLIRGENPVRSDLTKAACRQAMYEEYNDVLLTARVAGIHSAPTRQTKKLLRWLRRLHGENEGSAMEV